MKNYCSTVLILFLLFSISITALSQNSNSVTITGTVTDVSTEQPIGEAGIRILNAKDSTYVNGTATNDLGIFSVNVKSGQYLVQTSFMGYTDVYTKVNATKKRNSVGVIHLSEDGILLNEAVVTAKAPEIVVKGDTVEYSADLYNTQESAVLEDLVKKIPGAEIDEDGKITINGKEITKILVEGKEFFSDDPKIASKNLPAKMIEKLQVLDKKSEMAELTGFDDGDEETVINLTIKPGMKQGVFGSALAGYGNKDRYEGNGMINYMRNNTQMTGLLGINNTNNAGFNDFASTMLGGDGPPRGVRFGGRNGVTKAGNAGFNFATENGKKFKLNGDVRYGNIDSDVKSESNKTYTGINRSESSLSWGNNKSDNFGANFRLEWNPDTLTRIVFRPDFQYNKNRSNRYSEGETIDNDSIENSYKDNSKYTSDGDGVKFNGSLWISRKLSPNGRSISLRVSGGYNNSNTDAFNYSETDFYQDPARNDSILDQMIKQKNNGYNWRANLSYVEPIGRNNFLELTYNIRGTNSEMDKRTFRKDNSGTNDYTVIDTAYTRLVKNDFLNQNISLNFRSMRKNFNYMIGVGIEPSSTKTEITDPKMEEKIIPRKNYLNFAPRARFHYNWDKRHNLRVDYRGSAESPTAQQLYDGIISQNGFNVTTGNPNLRPSFENRVDIRYQKFNPEKASSMILFGRFTHTSNDIVTVSKYDGPSRITSYDNINGNWNGNLRFIFNFPLKNKKFSINSMSFGSYEKSNTLINNRNSVDPQKNRANIYRLRENMGLRFTSDLLEFNVRGNISYYSVNNSISTNSNKNTYDYGGYFDFTLNLPYDFRIDSDITYSTNSGYGEGFNRNEWLWNASISKDIFKAKNGTIRFKIYDILQERSNISRSISSESIQDSRTNTISSYFMFNFVYRFQIFKGGAKASDMRGPEGPPHRRGMRM